MNPQMEKYVTYGLQGGLPFQGFPGPAFCCVSNEPLDVRLEQPRRRPEPASISAVVTFQTEELQAVEMRKTIRPPLSLLYH
eukprot:3307452-Amphidinium_carterae.1